MDEIIGQLGLDNVDAVLSWCANDYVRIRGGTSVYVRELWAIKQ